MEPKKENVSTSYVEAMEDGRIKGQHEYEWVFSLKEALGTEEYQEEMEYKTYCRKSSCWEIIIKFEKDVPFHNFNMFVTLRRTDLSPFIVQGILVIWFVNVLGKQCPVAYRLECRLNGRGTAYDVFPVDEHIKCLLREDDYMTFPHDVLIVKPQLFVNQCCETSGEQWYPVRGLNAPANQEGSSTSLCPNL